MNALMKKWTGLVFPTGTRSYSSMVMTKLKDINHKNNQKVGRGVQSGRGKTSRRGQKGQKSRESIPLGFSGHQQRWYLRYPKLSIPRREKFVGVSVSDIQKWINDGRLDPSKPLGVRDLVLSGLCSSKLGIKIFARRDVPLTAKIDLTSNKASQAAIEQIEAAGGKFTAKYYSPVGLKIELNEKRLLEKTGRIPKQPHPLRRKDVEYYMNPENRGYLVGYERPEFTKTAIKRTTKPGWDERVRTLKDTSSNVASGFNNNGIEVL